MISFFLFRTASNFDEGAGDAADDENAAGAAGEGLDEVAGEDPEGEVVTPSGKNIPSTSSAKKTPKRYQKRQKQDDLEDELLAFI